LIERITLIDFFSVFGAEARRRKGGKGNTLFSFFLASLAPLRLCVNKIFSETATGGSFSRTTGAE
jgi:hypothetical protein